MQLRKRLKGSLRVTFGAMTVALTVMVLYMASVLPWGRIALYFMASVIMIILVEERELLLALAAFAAAGIITFLFVANKLFMVPYVAVLGHYAIFRQFAMEKVHDKWLQWFVKLLYINVFMALCILTVTQWLGILDLRPLLGIMPFWAWVALAQAVFIVYDILLAQMVNFYHAVLRPLLIGRKG